MQYAEYLRHIKALAETRPSPWLCTIAEDCPDTAGSDNHIRFGKDIRRALGTTSLFLPAALVRDGLIKPFSVPPGVDGSAAHWNGAARIAWNKQVRLDWLDEMIAAAEMIAMSTITKS